ncbi:MAG TPA: hypothetical protein GXX36_15460 [Clostridiaceae bacterium]|nr:hypothetical protein [Clostridiaceae bacterium]
MRSLTKKLIKVILPELNMSVAPNWKRRLTTTNRLIKSWKLSGANLMLYPVKLAGTIKIQVIDGGQK